MRYSLLRSVMAASRSLTVVVMLAGLAAGGLVRPGSSKPLTAAGIRPQMIIFLEKPACCRTTGNCCCVTAAAVVEEASVDVAACCRRAEPCLERSQARVAHVQENNVLCHAMEEGCSAESDSPLCQCTAEQRVPLEDSLPAGLPAPQTNSDLCDAASAENRLASNELTVVNSFGSVPIATVPLPLPVSVQLATLCCWRA